MQFNIYALVLLFAGVQGLFYVFQFSLRSFREERRSDLWMAGLILALCISNLSSMLGFMGIHVLGQELWFFPYDPSFLIGPMMLFYLKAQINVEFRLSRKELWHFLPFCVYFVHHLLVFCAGPNATEWWVKAFFWRYHLGDIEVIAGNVSLVVYLVLAWRLYRNYLKWLPNERSDIEKVQLRWYQHFLILSSIGVVAAMGFFIWSLISPLSFWQDWILRALVGLIICFISFHGYLQAQPHNLAFAGTPTNEPIDSPAEAESGNPSDPTVSAIEKADKLSAEELQAWCVKIDKLMHAEQLHLNPELTLNLLSERLGSYNALVSNVINAGFHKNFNDFVNTYRIEAFQEKVKDPKLSHYSLLALAFESGFNSKSTFNRSFKKITGKMPSDFVGER
jgi:AraC-like DNA-binding protein